MDKPSNLKVPHFQTRPYLVLTRNRMTMTVPKNGVPLRRPLPRYIPLAPRWMDLDVWLWFTTENDWTRGFQKMGAPFFLPTRSQLSLMEDPTRIRAKGQGYQNISKDIKWGLKNTILNSAHCNRYRRNYVRFATENDSATFLWIMIGGP